MSIRGKKNTMKSRTQQQFKDQVNINTIMRQFNKSRLIPQISGGMYGDFTGIKDYQSCCDRVIEAENMFNSLPSPIRERFRNNPGELIEFVQKEENRAEAITMGLVLAPKEPPVTSPEASKPVEEGGDTPPTPAIKKAAKKAANAQ